MDEKQLIKFLSKKGIRQRGDKTDDYWPEGKIRPHFHLTKGYIGTDSFNFIEKSAQQIASMWNGTKNNTPNTKSWDAMNPIIQDLIK